MRPIIIIPPIIVCYIKFTRSIDRRQTSGVGFSFYVPSGRQFLAPKIITNTTDNNANIEDAVAVLAIIALFGGENVKKD